MRRIEIERKAEEMEVPVEYALFCRKRYLTMRLWSLEQEIDCLGDKIEDWAEGYGGEWDIAFHISDHQQACSERKKIKAELKLFDIPLVPRTDGITEEMIEQARQHPVENLVEFIRGQALAWCHNDHHPSMFHGTRKNVAVCPVCNKTFNPIDILMERDGLSFIEAVKTLQ